jgi:hypothetical protein
VTRYTFQCPRKIWKLQPDKQCLLCCKSEENVQDLARLDIHIVVLYPHSQNAVVDVVTVGYLAVYIRKPKTLVRYH